MFSQSRISNDDSNDTFPPVPRKDLGSCFKEGHRIVLLDSRLVDHVIVDNQLAVGAR